MSIKIIELEEVGEVKIVKTRRAKRLSISIRPHKGVRVSMPPYYTFKWAEKFIKTKKSWIIDSLAKIQIVENSATLISKKEIEELRKQAKELFPIRVEELAKKYSFSFKSVSIRASKSRWGSCSYINSINLSLFLMTVPDYLRDYVIVHELAHTKIKNHGKDFWGVLKQIYTDPKKLDKELSKFKPGFRLSV